MKEFLTIGELADIFNMDVQLLRHYDAKGLLVPQVRNSENNRRFYHFDQVYPLATIRYLRRLDYSLAAASAAFAALPRQSLRAGSTMKCMPTRQSPPTASPNTDEAAAVVSHSSRPGAAETACPTATEAP